jgi:hypothetical protein
MATVRKCLLRQLASGQFREGIETACRRFPVDSQPGSVAGVTLLVKTVEEIVDGSRLAHPLLDGQIGLIGAVVTRSEVGNFEFGMAMLDDPRQRFRIRQLVALNEGIAEQKDLGTAGGVPRCLLLRGGAAALAPIGIERLTGLVGPMQVELAPAGTPAQVRIAFVFGCGAAPIGVHGPPRRIAKKMEHALGSGQRNGQQEEASYK